MRILEPDAPHRQPPKSTRGVHLPSTPDQVARPGPPWRGLHCCSPSSGAAASGSWNLFRDKTAASGSASPLGCVPACPSLPLLPHHTKTSFQRKWLRTETSGLPKPPIVAPQPQITYLSLKLGRISSKHGDIFIHSFVPESSKVQGGHSLLLKACQQVI